MRTARHILLTLLAIALLCPGLPLTVPEDANRDKTVNLEDAILRVRDLVRTAETPGSFSFEAETVISVLHHIAGLKRSIQPVEDAKSKSTSFTSFGFYLVPSVNTPCRLEESFPLSEGSVLCESLSLEPPTPPPEWACSSFTVKAV